MSVTIFTNIKPNSIVFTALNLHFFRSSDGCPDPNIPIQTSSGCPDRVGTPDCLYGLAVMWVNGLIHVFTDFSHDVLGLLAIGEALVPGNFCHLICN